MLQIKFSKPRIKRVKTFSHLKLVYILYQHIKERKSFDHGKQKFKVKKS